MVHCGSFISKEAIEERAYLFYEEKYKKLARSLIEQYEPIAHGRHRVTFDLGDFVLKVPRSIDGEHANLFEIENYKSTLDPMHPFNGKLAACTLIIINDISCVLMEKVFLPSDFNLNEEEIFPKWVNKFDAAQAGICPRTKNILVYDYADENVDSVYMVA